LPAASWGAQRSYISDNNQAVLRLNSGDFLGGIELLKQSLDKLPGDETIRANLRKAYLAAGLAFLKRKDYATLEKVMLEAQQFDDRQRNFWLLRGHALLRLQRYDEAEVDLVQARGMGEPDAQLLYMLGQVYYATDRMSEAFDVLESAALLDSQHQEIGQMFDKVRRELAVEREMDKEYGGHFIITFDGDENSDLGLEVLKTLEDIYNDLGSRLDHYPDPRVTVILYSRKQFAELTRSPDWAGGLYDGKIRLPVGGINRVDERVKQSLYHEYMHVILRDIAGNNLPYWLNEGLAETAEREFGSTESAAFPLGQQQAKLFSLQVLEGPFRNYRGQQVMLAYEQSYSFVHYLIDEYGWVQMRELLFALADGLTISAAVDRAFGIYGVSYQSLEKNWRESL